MSKNINMLMPESFIIDVYRFIVLLPSDCLDEPLKLLARSIESQLNAKLTAMKRHDLFSRYKSAPYGSPERERYRLDYFDDAGIHRDWRSDNEISL